MLALIAGQGDLPGMLLRHLQATGRPVLICVLAGNAPELPDGPLRLGFSLETFGTFLQTLQARGVTRLCMVGGISRPVIDTRAIDAATLPLIPRLQGALAKGDDGALRVIIKLIEEVGIAVLGIQELLPGLLPASGVLSTVKPDKTHIADAKIAEKQLAKMGQADLGQACVVAGGTVIITENETGTDRMLLGLQAPGGLLFKAPKPGQDRRVDLPTIGLQTVENAALAKLAGLVIEAGGVLVPELPEVLDALEAHKMFLWLRAAGS